MSEVFFQGRSLSQNDIDHALLISKADAVICFQSTQYSVLRSMDRDIFMPAGTSGIDCPELAYTLPCRCINNWLVEPDKPGWQDVGAYASESSPNCFIRLLTRAKASRYIKAACGPNDQPWLVCVFIEKEKDENSAEENDKSRFVKATTLLASVLLSRPPWAEGPLDHEILEAAAHLGSEIASGTDQHLVDRICRSVLSRTLNILDPVSPLQLYSSIHLFQDNPLRGDTGDTQSGSPSEPVFEIKRLHPWDYHSALDKKSAERLELRGLSDTVNRKEKFDPKSALIVQRFVDPEKKVYFKPGLANRTSGDPSSRYLLTSHAALFGECYYFPRDMKRRQEELAEATATEFVRDFFALDDSSDEDGTYFELIIPIVDRLDECCFGTINIEGKLSRPLHISRVFAAQHVASIAATSIQNARIAFIGRRLVETVHADLGRTKSVGSNLDPVVNDYCDVLASAYSAEVTFWNLNTKSSANQAPIWQAGSSNSTDPDPGPHGIVDKVMAPNWIEHRSNEDAPWSLVKLIQLVGTTGIALYRDSEKEYAAGVVISPRVLLNINRLARTQMQVVRFYDTECGPDPQIEERLRDARDTSRITEIAQWLRSIGEGFVGTLLVPIVLDYDWLDDRVFEENQERRRDYCSGVLVLHRTTPWASVFRSLGELRVFGTLVERLSLQQRMRARTWLASPSRHNAHDNPWTDTQNAHKAIFKLKERTVENGVNGRMSNGEARGELNRVHAVLTFALAIQDRESELGQVQHALNVDTPENVVKKLMKILHIAMSLVFGESATNKEQRVWNAVCTKLFPNEPPFSQVIHGIEDKRYLPLVLAFHNYLKNIKSVISAIRSQDDQLAAVKRIESFCICANSPAQVILRLENPIPNEQTDSIEHHLAWFPFGEPGEGRLNTYQSIYSKYPDVTIQETFEPFGEVRKWRTEVVVHY